MILAAAQWDPHSAAAWAGLLGMVHVPMFGKGKIQEVDESSILLDGQRASFAFLRTEDMEFAQADKPLSWSWSSHVRHTITIVPTKEGLYLRRWDQPGIIQKVKIPKVGLEAKAFLGAFESATGPKCPDVIRHILEPFRQIRARIDTKEAIWSVKLLNGLLIVADLVRKDSGRKSDANKLNTFKDVFNFLSLKERSFCDLEDVPSDINSVKAGDLVNNLLEPEVYTGCELYPSLLFRHAASRLYQEAHLEIERNIQTFFPGLEPVDEPKGVSSRRDVRFTPPNLARALVQKALEAWQGNQDRIIVLDPACGSGVFLIEALRELYASPGSSLDKIDVLGYDISEVSAYMAKFCLEYAKRDLINPAGVNTRVEKRDSLEQPWTNADIILMNPPFIPWQNLGVKQQEQVRSELGDSFRKRPDIAMAFVSKAVKSLKPGGVLACVLPAALLSSQSGRAWRERLNEEGSLYLLGCFEGYRYFSTSLVETAFLIYRKKDNVKHEEGFVEVLISSEGAEDVALRALRLKPEDVSSERVDHFSMRSQLLGADNWRPLRQKDFEQKKQLFEIKWPRISDLFEIKQGVRLGHRVFLLKESQFRELERREKKFFRPAAGGGSIHNGLLRRAEYVFYPYRTDGSSVFSCEDELRDKATAYYKRYLSPVKDKLAGRPRFANRNWWELSEKRAWQVKPGSRLVSTYFGESGSFAFDDTGDYVTVNGHAWFWKIENVVMSNMEEVPFEQTPIIWGYLALLNSRVFEDILSLFSVKLQGGQMRLEKRFLSNVPIPDFSDENGLGSSSNISQLIELGKEIHAGNLKVVREDVDEATRLVYGLP